MQLPPQDEAVLVFTRTTYSALVYHLPPFPPHVTPCWSVLPPQVQIGTRTHKTATQMLTTNWAASRTLLVHHPLAFCDHLYFWMSFDYSSANVRQKIINHKCIHYRQAPINCNMNINCASLSDKKSLKAQLLATFCSISDASSPVLSKWVITTDNHLQAAIKSFKLIPMTSLKSGIKLYLFSQLHRQSQCVLFPT